MIEVYFDGASTGPTGIAGCGIYIHHSDRNDEFLSIPLPPCDNHIAEFKAFLLALKHCEAQDYMSVSFRTDSQLVEQAVEKGFVKRESYKDYLKEAMELIQRFDLFFIKWIPTKENKNADHLAKQAILSQK